MASPARRRRRIVFVALTAALAAYRRRRLDRADQAFPAATRHLQP